MLIMSVQLCSLWPWRPLTLPVIALLNGHAPSRATPQFLRAPLESSHGLHTQDMQAVILHRARADIQSYGLCFL